MAGDDQSSIERFHAAQARVEGEPEFLPYRGTVLYLLGEDDEHWIWVAIAPIKQILY